MLRNVIILTALVAIISILPTRASESIMEELEPSLQETMDLANCVGMSVAVVSKGKVIYTKGFGYRDYDKKLPVTENTQLPIGSCTKAFTAFLVGQIEEEGGLDIDKSPREYLPELKFYNDKMNSEITIRDMLCHQTGLPRHDYSWYLFPNDSRDSLIKRIEHQEPSAKVREVYQYNNFMYMAAGLIVERISGSTWEENIQEKIFKPLGMNNSTLRISEMKKNTDFAFGYGPRKDDVPVKLDYHPIIGMAPAGSINSSAKDMSKWLLMLTNGGKLDDTEIVPESFFNQAISSQSIMSSGRPGTKRPDIFFSIYGFAWDLASYKGHYRVEHGGNIDGFTASTAFFPSDSLGIVVLANQNYSRVPSMVRNQIADAILGIEKTDWAEHLRKEEEEEDDDDDDDDDDDEKEKTSSQISDRVYGTKPTHNLEDYEGKYNHKGYGEFSIRRVADSLFADFPNEKLWLRHYHYNIFEPFEINEGEIDTNSSSGIYLHFHVDPKKGNIDGAHLNLEQSIDPILFRKQVVMIEIAIDELQKYIGEYEMGGVVAKIFMDDDGKGLRLKVSGQPEHALLAAKGKKFIIDGLEGYSIEFEEKEGKVLAAIFKQPNGNFRVPRKQ